MNRLLHVRVLSVLALGLAPAGVQAAAPLPEYLRDLDRPHYAGDWTLQCNSSRFCQIVGVAKVPHDHVGVRAVVLITRGVARAAQPRLRMAFIDAQGSLSVPRPKAHWRLHARGMLRKPRPIALGFSAADTDGAYRAAPDVAERVVGALRSWPRTAIGERGSLQVRMPRGDLDRLLRKMDGLQHPRRKRLTAAQEAEWLKEYHYTVVRSVPADEPAPDALRQPCDGQRPENQPQGVRLDRAHLLWTALCPGGTRVFLQRGNAKPVPFSVRDDAGTVRPHRYAGVNAQSLLELELPFKGQGDCGWALKMGFNGTGFNLIEDRRYFRCRGVPKAFWPIVWHPTSWKYADPPPSNGGNAPPAIEGVSSP
ncbi:MAG: hypothetical protein ACKOPO_10115 [Novosphingobium sp.]